MGAFSRRYKLVVAPAAGPSLFDLEKDPDELTNLFTSPAHRDTVRQLARELSDYGQTFHEPHFASARVKADLAWAVSSETNYKPPATTPPESAADRKAKRKAARPAAK